MTSSSDTRPMHDLPLERAALLDTATPRYGHVLEGMPGAGKTTALAALAHEHTVLGEYTNDQTHALDLAAYPSHDDDQPHLTNWLRKDAQTRHLTRIGPVVVDRNWLTALAWAASLDDDLTQRARWAHTNLTAGRLTLPERWIILDCSVETSLTRRQDRLDYTHPWAHQAPLRRLRAFYTDPALAVAPVQPELADLIASVPVTRLDTETSPGLVRRAISGVLS